MRVESLASREQETPSPAQGADAALGRAARSAPGVQRWPDALPWLLILLLLLLSPLLYDLLLGLGAQ